jgi:hypothetical protein
MAKGPRDVEQARRRGVSTGVFLPSEILHSSNLLSRLGDQKTNARQAGHVVQRLLGFWFVYNAMGGLDAMIASGLWPKSTAYKQLAEFREFYGCSPDELEPGLVESVVAAAASWPAKYRDGLAPVVERYRRERSASG